MRSPDRIYMRLFTEASPPRSAELATALCDVLAGYGSADLHEAGPYWKIASYLEFNIDLTPFGSAPSCIAGLRTLEPTGWSDEVWNHRPDGPSLLLPEVRWIWVTTR